MIILPPDTMSPEDIKSLRENDICVVEATDPARVKFVDPIPAQSSQSEIERASIRLSRLLINGQWNRYYNGDVQSLSHKDFAYLFVTVLKEGTILDSRGSLEDRSREAYEQEKFEEIRRIAREDARALREAEKKAKLLSASQNTEKSKK